MNIKSYFARTKLMKKLLASCNNCISRITVSSGVGSASGGGGAGGAGGASGGAAGGAAGAGAGAAAGQQ